MGASNSDQLVKGLVSLNIFFFILSIAINPKGTTPGFDPFRFLSPDHQSLFALGSTGTIPVLQLGRWWTLVSANYLHGGLLHILFNMLALRQLLPLAVNLFGSYRTILIYTLGGVIGFLISTLAGVYFTIGASAALCSLIGAILYYGKNRGGPYGNAVFGQIGGWAVSIGIFGFLFPGINNWGHGGGMAAGVLLALLLGYKEKKKETTAHKYLATACLLGTICTLLWAFFNGILFFFYK